MVAPVMITGLDCAGTGEIFACPKARIVPSNNPPILNINFFIVFFN
jgi:hypothetical protein